VAGPLGPVAPRGPLGPRGQVTHLTHAGAFLQMGLMQGHWLVPQLAPLRRHLCRSKPAVVASGLAASGEASSEVASSWHDAVAKQVATTARRRR
jgi:hypothetical protein